MAPGRRKTTWAAVADGGKALVLVNEGTDKAPLLYVVSKDELENPRTAAQGTDRPGRRPDSGPGQRSAMEPTDWHALGEARFLRDFAGRLHAAAGAGRFERLILVAPPKVLGELRAALSPAVASLVAAEIPSDLTGHPVSEIEMHLAKAMGS